MDKCTLGSLMLTNMCTMCADISVKLFTSCQTVSLKQLIIIICSELFAPIYIVYCTYNYIFRNKISPFFHVLGFVWLHILLID